MKVELPSGRVAQFGVSYSDKVPTQAIERGYDLEFMQKFRSVTINLTIWEKTESGLVESFGASANSFCHPNDRFIKKKGRSRAMRRLMKDTPHSVLPKEDRAMLCPIMLHGHRQLKKEEEDSKSGE